MIQKATVGVGIIGKEGSQAKLSSDYAVPKFRMLKRLLVVHGRYSFKRSSQFIQYSFYKNIVLTFVQVFFTFYNLFTGQTLIESYTISLYNTIFNLLNPLVFGLMEKDIDERFLENSKLGPILYSNLKKDNILNAYSFAKWIGSAIIHSAMIFFITIYSMHNCMSTKGRSVDDLWLVSILASSNVFCVVNLKCYLEMEHFTIIHHSAMIFSFLTFYGYSFIYAGLPMLFSSSSMHFVWFEAIKLCRFWLVHLICVVAPLAFDSIMYGLKIMLYPELYQVLKMQKFSLIEEK